MICSLLIEVLVASPGNTSLCHVVKLVLAVRSRKSSGLGEGIVEHGVGDETAGVVGLVKLALAFVLYVKRVTLRPLDLIETPVMALELVRVKRLDVAAMVLVEVRQVLVEEDGGAHALGDGETQVAAISGDIVELELDFDISLNGPSCVDGLVGALECGVYVSTGHGSESISVVVVRSIGNAVCVIKANFLDLR